MPMEHKAYAFDWSGFELDLHQRLTHALTVNDTAELEVFIDEHLAELTDPYEAKRLSSGWRNALVSRDVQEYADYALTRFYDPADCWGVGYAWQRLSDSLPENASKAMLGLPVGSANDLFDPGRYGSYFQTPGSVRESFAALRTQIFPELARYLELLERCVTEQCGVYVTF